MMYKANVKVEVNATYSLALLLHFVPAHGKKSSMYPQVSLSPPPPDNGLCDAVEVKEECRMAYKCVLNFLAGLGLVVN
jgi:hypothetical protein